MMGRLTDALPILERAVEHAHLNRTVEAGLRTYFAEACLLAGRRADAAAAAAGALELSRQRAERGVEARVLYLLAEIAAHGQPIEAETALDRYQQAASLADALGQRSLVAHCHLGLGKLYWRTAKRAEAEAELVVATKL